MKYSELIQLYFERSNALQWYWTLYVVIIGGLLAFSSLRKQPDRMTGILVTILFCFFAYKNLGAIRDVTEQRIATLQLIKAAPADTAEVRASRDTLEPTMQPPQFGGVKRFHITSDVVTVLALWTMELRRKRMARLNPGVT